MPDIQPALSNSAPAINRYGEMCAEVYVLDKPPGALGDIPYYTEQLRTVEGPILEAGCGSGRLMIPLLQAGFDVHGFDQSEHMLAQAQIAADQRGLTLKTRRMRFEDFSYEERFGAIYLPVGTFTLIDDFAAALAALKRFHAHLRPGGRLFIDLMPLRSLTGPTDGVRSWTTPSGDILCFVAHLLERDMLGQRTVSYNRYERWRGGRLVEAELETLVVRSWALKEFELTLKEAGFADISVRGDYREGQPPRSNNQYWCFQAARPA